MKRKYLLALSFVAAVVALSGACSPKFTSCDDRGTCASVALAGAAGRNSGRQEQNGNSGKSGTGGDASDVGGDAGSGGAGGAPDESPILFNTCSAKGELACEDHSTARRLACDGHHWQAGTTCPEGQLCDSADGQCSPVVPECAAATPGATVCRDDQVLTCGPDLVTALEGETCVGRCKLGVCQPPACGDQKVEPGEDCDNDAKHLAGDGCSAACRAEPIALALGGNTTCALSSTGLVKCWGFNGAGELGLGDTDNRGSSKSTVPSALLSIDLGTDRKATAISVSSSGSACALLDGGELKCWGFNEFGQLGTGSLLNRGDKPNQMGDALKPIPLGSGRKAIGVSAGSDYTCAVLDDGSVKCWGFNGYGRLGTENSANLQAPDPVTSVKLGRKAKAVSASADGVTCALLDDGMLKCWGNIWFATHADYAELGGNPGIGDFAGEISALPALTFGGAATVQSLVAGRVSAAILSDGSLRLWGNGDDGPLGSGTVYLGLTPTELTALPPVDLGTGQTIQAIALGTSHACALLTNGQVKCWGNNSAGQLGLGTTDAVDGTPAQLDPVNLGGHRASQVAAGQSHSCAILDDGTVRCWGANSVGQLGLGDTQSRGDSGGKLGANTLVDLLF